MTKLPGWNPGDPLRVLVFGRMKVGKTFGAATFPRPVFMDFDRGIATAFGPDFVRKYGVKRIVARQFYERSYKGPIVQLHNAYDDACRFFDEMMKQPDEFDTWVIDSLTMLSEYAMNKAVVLLGSKEYHYMSQTHKEALAHGLLLPKVQDYGAERSLVEQFVDMVLSTPKNVVAICHEKEIKDRDGNTIQITPLLTGQSREAVPLRFDEVYWINARRRGMEWQRVCITEPDGLHAVGSRNGVPNETLWDYDSLVSALTDLYNFRSAAVQASSDEAGVRLAANS